MEFMIHRRLLHDDDRGVEEPLNETVDGKSIAFTTNHWVSEDSKTARSVQYNNDHQPVIYVSNVPDIGYVQNTLPSF